MAIGWSGADPAAFTDPPGSTYELGTKYTANGDLTVTHVRVWAGPTSVAVVNRKGRIWTAAGVLLGTATLVNSLPSGWSQYALDTPLTITAGTTFWVTYSVLETYGANTSPGYPRNSADGVVTAAGGGLNTAQGNFPGTFPNTFYGVDIVYTAGNQAPVAGVTVQVTAALTAQATLTIQDESPATCTSVIEWGDGATTNAGNGLGPFTHVYAAAGTYAVMVTTTDSAGLKDSAAAPVTVVAAFTGLDIEAIQQAMANAADTIPGLRCFPALPGSISPPTFAPVEFELSYHGTFSPVRGLTEIMFTCGVYAPNSNAGRKMLLPLLAAAGVGSVPAALEADKTLGGACRQLVVQRVRGAYRLYTVGDTDYLGAMIDVKVWA